MDNEGGRLNSNGLCRFLTVVESISFNNLSSRCSVIDLVEGVYRLDISPSIKYPRMPIGRAKIIRTFGNLVTSLLNIGHIF